VAAYWGALLGLYCGATVAELAQLTVADVKDEGPDGLWLSITDTGDGQRVKNEHRRRDVPVHSELMRLGFGEFVQAVRDSGAVSLWPNMTIHPDRPSVYFSNWWGDFRRARIDGSKVELFPDFHSMRHTARSAMANAGHAESLQDTITGHAKKGGEGVRRYTHYDREPKRRAVESIRYDVLAALPKVYPGGLVKLPAPRSNGRATKALAPLSQR
jgi:integrase